MVILKFAAMAIRARAHATSQLVINLNMPAALRGKANVLWPITNASDMLEICRGKRSRHSQNEGRKNTLRSPGDTGKYFFSSHARQYQAAAAPPAIIPLVCEKLSRRKSQPQIQLSILHCFSDQAS